MVDVSEEATVALEWGGTIYGVGKYMSEEIAINERKGGEIAW